MIINNRLTVLISPLLLLTGCLDLSRDNYSLDSSNIPAECRVTESDYGDNDPLIKYQWHLEALGVDDEVWNGQKGSGVKISVIDSGVECNHQDLHRNIDFDLSYNYRNKDNNPSPTELQLYDYPIDSAHGTACAGIISAVGWNGKGVIGVAPSSSIVALNTFSTGLDADFEDALQKEGVDISNNSWGGGDSTILYDDPSSLIGIEVGVKNNRNGLGTIYIFASGNEGNNANYSMLHGSPYVINVGAVNIKGDVPKFSNFGENIAVVAPAGDNESGIFTTDLIGKIYGFDGELTETPNFTENSNGDYTGLMNGTSSAVPIVSGVVALLLEANRNLSYRDVKYILMKTASIPENIKDKSNGANIKFSPKYGFGVIDPKSAIDMAKNYKSLPTEETILLDNNTQKLITNNYSTIRFNVDRSISVEHLRIKVDIDHTDRDISSLKIVIVSPSGTESEVLSGDSKLFGQLDNWLFTSLRFLDEDSKGEWQIKIKDLKSSNKFTTNSLGLEIRGHNPN